MFLKYSKNLKLYLWKNFLGFMYNGCFLVININIYFYILSTAEFNGYNGDTMSRKSGHNIQPMLPVVTVPGGDYAASDIGTQASLRRFPHGNFQL